MSLPIRALLGCLLVLTTWSIPLRATTIIPFANLGDMAQASDAVVVVRAGETRLEEKGNAICRRTPFQVVDVIKGELQSGAAFDMDSWWRRQGDRETTIWGDPVYESGTTYLLFLNKLDHAPYWQPMLLAYGQFYLRKINGVDFFFPSRESQEIHAFPRPDGIVPETMKVMLAKDLIQHLRQVVSGKIPWQEKLILPEGEVKDLEADFRAPPGHCTFIEDPDDGTPVRYEDFPGTPMTVFCEDDGDAFYGLVSSESMIQNAIANMESSYSGIDFSYPGTYDYEPDCGDNSALGLEIYYAFNDRECIVIFNDPCGEIPDLSNCNGTLALGGVIFFQSVHQHDNMDWYTGTRSYVLMNNGVGPCNDSDDYTLILIHELSHGLGIGHIASGNGAANMNPSCCNGIMTLDIDCLDYTYPAAPLPVELIKFSATEKSGDVHLNWSTATEVNNDYFQVQRSMDGEHFQDLAVIPGQGTTTSPHHYSWLDRQPGPGQWYYRLRQVDLDGQFAFSPIVTIQLDGELSTSRIFPNPLSHHTLTLQRQAVQEGEVHVQVIAPDQSVTGRQIFYQQKGGNQWDISLPDLQPGIYFLKVQDERQSEVIRFCITR